MVLQNMTTHFIYCAVLVVIFRLSDFLSDSAERIIILKIVHKRTLNRFYKFLLYMGYSTINAREAKINVICKVVAEFSLEYRTTREKVLQQRQKKENQRERKKTRGKMIVDVSMMVNEVLRFHLFGRNQNSRL